MNTRTGIAALAVVALAGQAMAFVPWNNTNGSTSNFFWRDGGSANGRFGSPVVANDTFIFNPTSFRADSANGVAAIVGDQLTFTLEARPGFNVTQIRITEFGDWAINGQGPSVSADGTMFVTNLDVFDVATGDLSITPGVPITTPGSGQWQGTATVNIAPPRPNGWRLMRVQLNNNLSARSTQGTSSFIEKKVGGVKIEIIPAPGAIALLGLGALVAGRRRRA